MKAEIREEFKKEKERKIGRKNRRMEKYMRRKEGKNRGGNMCSRKLVEKKSAFARKAYVLKLYKDCKYHTYCNSAYPLFRRGLAALINAESS